MITNITYDEKKKWIRFEEQMKDKETGESYVSTVHLVRDDLFLADMLDAITKCLSVKHPNLHHVNELLCLTKSISSDLRDIHQRKETENKEKEDVDKD